MYTSSEIPVGGQLHTIYILIKRHTSFNSQADRTKSIAYANKTVNTLTTVIIGISIVPFVRI